VKVGAGGHGTERPERAAREEALHGRGGRAARTALAKRAGKRAFRFDGRSEGAARLELERAGDPAADRARAARVVTASVGRCSFLEHRWQGVRELFSPEDAPQQQREGQYAELHHVGLLVESHPARGRWGRDAKQRPQLEPRALKRLQGAAEHVLDKDDRAVGAQYDALRADGPVRGVGRVLVQRLGDPS